MTDKPITQADLDAFRAEIVAAFRESASQLGMYGYNVEQTEFGKMADILATPPKPRPELPTEVDWSRLDELVFTYPGMSVEWIRFKTLIGAIVSGSVDLPRYKEER